VETLPTRTHTREISFLFLFHLFGSSLYMRDLLLLAVLGLLLLQITVHPPDGTVSGAGAATLTRSDLLTAKLASGDTDGSLGGDESLVELLSEWAGVELGKKVLCTKTLDARELALLGETSLLSLVGTDTLVHLLESETSLADLRVLVTTGHGTAAEIGRVSDCTILVEEVLKEGHTAIKVNIDLLTKLLLALDGSHHLRLRHGEVVLPVGVLGVVEELAELLVEVETDIEVEVSTLIVLIEVLDTLGVHIGVLNHLPSDGEDELGLALDLGPVGVEEGDGLLVEGLLADSAEVVKRFLVKLLDERGHG